MWCLFRCLGVVAACAGGSLGLLILCMCLRHCMCTIVCVYFLFPFCCVGCCEVMVIMLLVIFCVEISLLSLFSLVHMFC